MTDNADLHLSRQAQILLPLPGVESFDYLIPDGVELARGQFVEVPFRNRQLIGVVWGLAQGDVPKAKLKSISRCLDIQGLQENLRKFVDRVAEYTFSSSGSILKMVLSVPAALKPIIQPPYYSVDHDVPIRLTPERARVRELYQDHQPRLLKTIAEQAQVSSAVIATLRKSGFLKQCTVVASEPVVPTPSITLPALSDMQVSAVEALKHTASHKEYSVSLLDGVTGSGKTEVYFSVIAQILTETSGQVLIMLPEIVLTSQLLMRFETRFGFLPSEWHSGMSIKAKREVWQGVASGEVRLVIGARSALFLPFWQLALIVVDEEHEGAYKQEEGVLYHARDMAVLRAFIEKIPLILASATPSLETLINCETNKFSRVHLPSRHGDAGLAEMHIVDMKQEQLPRNQFLSMKLKTALASALESGHQAMLFLNRRGYAPLTLCRSCGHRLACPHCSTCLVEHRYRRRLECHHCGFATALPKSCPSCNEEDVLVSCGPGVERVAEELSAYLPKARIALMTKDTIADASDADAMVTAILGNQIDIIIGTQMIAKGHHFPNLTLVGVVDADLGLAGGDLRAAERTYQLLHQVSGRAGREAIKGTVILQSYMPENTIIQSLVLAKRDEFMQMESFNRQQCGMPPFTRLAAIILSGIDEAAVTSAAKALAKLAPVEDDVMVLGPAPALLYQLRGKYRYRLLVKAERSVNIQKYMRYWLSLMKLPSSVKIKVDIDPYNFF